MTIRTQQPKVTHIGFPITEAVPPRSLRGANFRGCVYMVDIKRPEIVKPAFYALAAKLRYQDDLFAPMGRLLVNGPAVLVPVSFQASRRAISNVTRFATGLTYPVSGPAVRQITLLAAIFSGSFSNPISMHFRWLLAAGADDCNWCGSHSQSVSQYRVKYEPKYFDISCRRIEAAQRQRDLFIEPPRATKPVQEAML